MLVLRHNLRGFTLIELIVSMVILAILAAVGTPTLMTWIQNSQLRTASETISNGLQLARTEAVQRNSNVLFTLTGTANTNVDSTWQVCMPDVFDPTLCGPTIIQARSGVEGTTYATVNATSKTVSFNGLGRASNAMTVHVKPPATGPACQAQGGPMRCLDIVVSPGGQILMCNPAYHRNTNPQGC